MKLVVQIPAYNEEKSIVSVIKEIPRKIKGIDKVEVLVIDDGSKDDTVKLAKEAGADHIIRNRHNKGLGPNFKRGIEYCLSIGADIIVNIDGDGQFNSRDVPVVAKPILDGEADMVTVSRFLQPEKTKNMPWVKKWGNRRFTKLISRITGQKFTDTQCGFRAYSREAAMKLNLQGKFTYTQEVFIDLAEKGMRIVEVPSEVKYFEERKSFISGNLRKYGFRSLGIIARATRDTQPLTFFGLPGVISFIIGLLGGIYSFWYWATHLATTPIRMVFGVSVFFIVLGVLLIIFGLLADMLLTLKKNQEEIIYRIKKSEFNETK